MGQYTNATPMGQHTNVYTHHHPVIFLAQSKHATQPSLVVRVITRDLLVYGMRPPMPVVRAKSRLVSAEPTMAVIHIGKTA
jgi:hypothetical protein